MQLGKISSSSLIWVINIFSTYYLSIDYGGPCHAKIFHYVVFINLFFNIFWIFCHTLKIFSILSKKEFFESLSRYYSVQFSRSIVSDSPRPHGLQHARPPSLSITNFQDLLKLMSIESVMPSNHLILYHPLLLLPPIFPSIRVFSNEPVLCIRWPKYWSFSFSISPSNEYSGLCALGWSGWISLQVKGLSRVFSNTTVQKDQFFCTKLSL